MENQYTQSPTPPIPPTPPVMENHIPVRAKTWLVESILATIFCCLPFGIAGIVNAIKVNSLHDQTRYEESRRASKNAKKWTMVALTIGILYLVFILIMASAGSLSDISLPGTDSVYF